MYAIGKPGGAIRMYLEASYDSAEAQLLAGEVVVECAGDLGPATMMMDGTILPVPIPVPTIAAVEADLLAQLDRERETRQMTLLTAGGAKKYVYSRKSVEVERASGIVATDIDALSATDSATKYPFAHAEASITGEKLSVVLARFTAGLKSSGKVEAIEARAQSAKRAVKAATTVAAKRAAAVVNWSV